MQLPRFCLGLLTYLAVLVVLAFDTVLATNQVMPPSAHRRLEFEKHSNLSMIYQQLETYILHPETAASVREFIFDLPAPIPKGTYVWPKPAVEEWRDSETNRTVSDESIMYRGIEQLGLSSKREEHQWAKTLTWMASEVADVRRTPEGGVSVTHHFKLFVGHQNNEFLNHAAALLLMLCPNIERLVYRETNPFGPVKQILNRNNYGTLPHKHLQNLKEIVVLATTSFLLPDHGISYMATDILALVRMFHRLPSIESIYADGMESSNDFDDRLPPGSTKVTKIMVTHSKFDSDVMAALIRAPIALEELVMTTGGRNSRENDGVVVPGEEIGKALLCQKASLIKLDLDLGLVGEAIDESVYGSDEYNFEWQSSKAHEVVIDLKEAQGPFRAMELPADRHYGDTIGSLHDFNRLTHLSMNIMHILGEPVYKRYVKSSVTPPRLINALPPNLEYLLLRGYKKGEYPDIDEQVAEMLRMAPEKIPTLKRIDGVDEHVPQGEDVDLSDRNSYGKKLGKSPDFETRWREEGHDEL